MAEVAHDSLKALRRAGTHGYFRPAREQISRCTRGDQRRQHTRMRHAVLCSSNHTDQLGAFATQGLHLPDVPVGLTAESG